VKSGVFLTILCSLFFVFAKAQVTADVSAPSITVRGHVFDVNDSFASPAPIIINKRTSNGQSYPGGSIFSIAGLKTDTFMITAGGYEVKRICFRDSVLKDVYQITIGLAMKTNLLKPVAIYPIKDLSQIQKERESLGVVQTRQTVGITDAVESPITYLYERYSRDGKSRQAVAVMENEDKMREVYKELFRTYNRAGVIDLDESEFDQFINYLNLPEYYLKTASDYELACTIREKYLQYRAAQQIHNRNQR